MFRRFPPLFPSISSMLALAFLMPVAAATAQETTAQEATAQEATAQAAPNVSDLQRKHSVSGEHVKEQIDAIVKRASEGLTRISTEVRDYECILVKRERVEGKLGDYQYLQAKVRHEQRKGDKVTVPFSVYIKFLKPKNIVGREVIYIQGKNEGDLIARRGGRRQPNMTVQLEPDSALAMADNRYPITEIGVMTLIERLIEVLQKDVDPDHCEIKRFDDAKLDGRPCTHFELSVTKKHEKSRFMSARLFVDNEYRVPTYYAAYDWPEKEGGEPVLLEEYTYRNLKANVGLTDKDFDTENPAYGFQNIEPLPDEE